MEMLRERMAPTQAYIESLISIQLAYINTNHPDFIGGSMAMSMLERKHEKRRREARRVSHSIFIVTFDLCQFFIFRIT